MKLEQIRKANLRILLTKSESIEEYYKVGRSFIIDLLSGIGKLSMKYRQFQLIDFPYLYGERQLSSVILPTLSKICDGAVLAELPARRNCRLQNHEIENSSGRIDYWCIYKDYSIALEVKHSYDAFLSDITRESRVVNRWEYMTIDQLQSIKEDVKYFEEPTKGILRIGLHFVISYSDKHPTKDLVKEYENKLPDILNRLQNDLCKRKPTITTPDFMACWLPPTQMVLEGEGTYPGIILVGKIFKPIVHKGASVMKYRENLC